MNPKREDRIAISMGLSCKGRKGSHVNRIPVKMTISFDSSPLLGHKLLFQSNKSHSQPQFPDFIWIKLGFTTQLKHKLLPSFCFVCTISSSPPLFGREGVSQYTHTHLSCCLSDSVVTFHPSRFRRAPFLVCFSLIVHSTHTSFLRKHAERDRKVRRALHAPQMVCPEVFAWNLAIGLTASSMPLITPLSWFVFLRAGWWCRSTSLVWTPRPESPPERSTPSPWVATSAPR